MTARRAISASFVLGSRGGKTEILTDHTVVVEGDRIVDVTPEEVVDAETIRVGNGFLIPGLINLHNHTLNAPLFRGIVDDLPKLPAGGTKVYSLLMPVGRLAVQFLDEDELAAMVELGLLEVALSGATTVVDMFRSRQALILDVARRFGMRFYGAPYIFSAPAVAVDRAAAESSVGAGAGDDTVEAFVDMHRRYDEGPGGRIRVILGPHATDTCDPDLLSRIDRVSREMGLPVTIHAAQSRREVEALERTYGSGTADYLERAGLLREGVVLAHGIFFTDEELDRIGRAGATVANCASVFLRGGTPAPFERFLRHGVRVGIGTDAERMDVISQMRTTGFVSKQWAGEGHAGVASDLLAAATQTGASALGRGDLGRIEPGAKADLVVVSLGGAHLQPVRDPIRSLVWYASAHDVHTVMVDGRDVVRDGRFVRGDAASIVSRGAAAVEKVWAEAERRGFLDRPTTVGAVQGNA